MSLLNFTGNPLVDAGNAVITMMCGKRHCNEVTEENIIQHIDNFLGVISSHFNYQNASKKELAFSRRGLKQHFTLLHNINHYLFGINNKVLNSETGKKETVESGQQFTETFKNEVINILNGRNKLTEDEERRSNNNICRFCGRPAELIITKDIVPLAAGLSQKNLGQVHCCNYCYLPILFNFIVMINVKSTEESKGMYMFYQFSDEEYMIEYARQQFNYLKNNSMSSIQTKIGPQYEILVDDLLDRLPKLQMCTGKTNQPTYITAYFLLNDNRGAIFNFINIPDGVCKFLIQISNIEDSWSNIRQNLRNREEYNDFFTGSFQCMRENGEPKMGFEDQEIMKFYLKEVSNVDDKLINASESIANGLLKYYRSQSSNWVEQYDKKMNVEKAYNFINSLLDVNEEYFKLNGENIFIVSDVSQVIESNAMAFRLIKYFIHNKMSKEEKQFFVELNRKRANKGGE